LHLVDEVRAELAEAAANFFEHRQPATTVAVTGTNGKTSVVDFCRQMWRLCHGQAASIGTLGVIAPGFASGESLTTPDSFALHDTLSRLSSAGVEHVALEASSHGLDQKRLDAVNLSAAGFTNLTRDHLDYHGGMDAYRHAKLRLFDQLLPDYGAAVFNAQMESPTLEALRSISRRRQFRSVIEVGGADSPIRLAWQRPTPGGQNIRVEAFGQWTEAHLAIPGLFQAENMLLALGLVMGTGLETGVALATLGRLAPVRGRMELAATLPNGAAVYVDYAHTPDALTRLLDALRPHVAQGAKLHVLFGAGGDRDAGKRPLMGAAADQAADQLWVTDDNPRSEDPATIRAAILAAAPGARDAGERAAAIALALNALKPGDVLAVAGKGHESGQTIAGVTMPFDDVEVVRRLVGIGA